MSPRPYNLGRRQDQIDHARRQILDAARALLGEATRYAEFSIDAVAKRSDVARATVYYQFGSKTGLLEALCDDLAETGQMSELARVFTTPDPDEALSAFVACFGRFWDADRTVMRRLRALGALDPDVATVIAARDQRRRDALSVLVERLTTSPGREPVADPERTVGILHVLTSFETFDALVSANEPLGAAAADIVGLAQQALRPATPSTKPPGRAR
ncbi:MAG: TetR/AcrR family transcriptional regulator [Acidimicrobiales bacterium]